MLYFVGNVSTNEYDSSMPKRTQAEVVTRSARDAADIEIRAKQQEVKYDLRDFTIDYIVKEFKAGLFFIPLYQRKFVWDKPRQCKFVESVLLGLPMPMMFVADLDDGRLEIVDGAQRIQTLAAFIDNDLKLSGLPRLPALNGFCFKDLPEAHQRKIGTKALRMVILEDTTTAETRQEIFNRINTSLLPARGAEVRRGAFSGPFTEFIKKCAQNKHFRILCPISEMLINRREDEELVLRFFCYSDNYGHFKHDVESFLGEYLSSHRNNFDEDTKEREYHAMLKFVKEFFPSGFAKSPSAKSTPRVRFEAISVGVNLALRQQPKLRPHAVSDWVGSEEFAIQTTTHASNSGPRLRARIEYVRDKLLGK